MWLKTIQMTEQFANCKLDSSNINANACKVCLKTLRFCMQRDLCIPMSLRGRPSALFGIYTCVVLRLLFILCVLCAVKNKFTLPRKALFCKEVQAFTRTETKFQLPITITQLLTSFHVIAVAHLPSCCYFLLGLLLAFFTLR